MLNGIIFICGAAVMALEILGSRVLSPYFGTDIYVWGSLISVFLAALSGGYYIGGRVAAHGRPWLRLGLVILGAGILTAMIPKFSAPVNDWLFNIPDVRIGALLSALILFAAPTFLLGMVTPLAVHIAVNVPGEAGSRAGTLYAISTLGSIVGTLSTSFYLIAWFFVSTLISITGIMLVVLGGGILVLLGLRRKWHS